MQNLEAEKSILAAALSSPNVIIDLAPELNATDFSSLQHQIIYKTMLEIAEAGGQVDMVTVGEKIQGRVELTAIVQLTESFITTQIDHYIQIVKDCSFLRRTIKALELLKLKAENKEYDSLDKYKAELQDSIIALDITKKGATANIKEIVIGVIDDLEKRKEKGIKGVKTYIEGLDSYLNGIQPQDFMIIAARPSMGKTALAVQIALKNSLSGKIVYFVTLEMSKESLVERMLINLSQIDGKRMKIGDLSDGDYKTLAYYSNKIYNSSMIIDETSSTVAAIRANARRIKGLGLIVVDYIGYMESHGKDRVEQVTNISRGLKGLARELKVPVMALSQLNRMNEGRQNKRPMLSDLRESGAIEQDADICIFIHREDYYKQKQGKTDLDGQAELIIAKHRNGPTGIVACNYDESTMRFYHDWVQEAQKIRAEAEVRYD
jgi:replicative DNA helicase